MLLLPPKSSHASLRIGQSMLPVWPNYHSSDKPTGKHKVAATAILWFKSQAARYVCERHLEGIVAKHRGGLYEIKNPTYTQAEGRDELFDELRT